MYTTRLQPNKWICRIAMLALTTNLLGGCGQVQQLGIEGNPQEILDKKLNNPQVKLTANESITLVDHCAKLGERSAATSANKVTCLALGNTGVGKSTLLNGVMGCKLKLVKPRELGLDKVKKVVIVDPGSTLHEVMPIGHTNVSQTFMPQIASNPDDNNQAYCDCPGFSDTRGEEINIANAISIRKVLQQARGINAIFLTSYNGLDDDRGSSIQKVEAMCEQMFGGVDNLRRYQNAVLLGITKVPLYYEDDEPMTLNVIRSLLTMTKGPIAEILANRVFLFDPLDRASDNPDFWSLERCRKEIAQLQVIPQQEATALFQTVLTGDDQLKLKYIMRTQANKLATALERDDYETAGQYWQSLARLRVIESDEVEKMVRELAGMPLRNFVLRRIKAYEREALLYNFEEADRQLGLLRTLLGHFPHEKLECDVKDLEAILRNSKEKKRREDESIRKNLEQAKREEAKKAREEAEKEFKKKAAELIEDYDSGCCTIS